MYKIYSLDNITYFLKKWTLGLLSLFTAFNFFIFYWEIKNIIFHKMKTEDWKYIVSYFQNTSLKMVTLVYFLFSWSFAKLG